MSTCCTNEPHLVVIGGGSAAFAAALEAESRGATVTIVNDGLPMGGTCVNVGCVPSKFLLRAAEAHHQPEHHDFDGIDGRSRADVGRVFEQQRELVDQLRGAKYHEVLDGLERVTYCYTRARLLDDETVELEDGEFLEPDAVILATGASTATPNLEGIEEVDYLTNELVFELEGAADSLLVLGGGYVGLESAQTFARFGTDVTLIDHSRILSGESDELTDGLARYLRDEGIAIVEHADLVGVRPEEGGVRLAVAIEAGIRSYYADEMLVATGRRPNTEALGADETGVDLDDRGFIEVDGHLQTSVEPIYGAGDVVGDPMYVYTAAHEGKLAARNALGDEPREVDYHPLPWVVFTDPQVAGVGYNLDEARSAGYDPEATTLPLSEVPHALASRDTRGFIRLVRDRQTHRLLGGRILASEGSELLMELAVAIRHETTTEELTDLLHPYLTRSEGIRLAALTFDRDVDELSCCAS